MSQPIVTNFSFSFTQLRTKYWSTPEAVFEIVGAGNQIPLWFNLLQSDNLILKGPWIGVAICTVIAVDDIGALIESKYVVTAHIHLGERHWTVPVHVNYVLVARLGTQLVFYWTVVDDLQRLVYSNQTNNFGVSFSVQPRDGKLQVTKFGIRFIYDEDIWQLKRYDYYKIVAVNILQKAYSSLPSHLDRYLHAWEADTDLCSRYSIIHDHSSSVIKFILDYGNQRDSLNHIQKICKCVVEINKEAFMVLNEFKEEWRHAYLFPLFNWYYEINLGISLLYDDFIRLLKDISDSWLSVKLALEQIVTRNRAEDYSYQEMLQQLNDLEAAECVRFSHSHVKSFAYTFDKTVGFFKHLDEDIKDLKSVKVLGKVSSTIIAGVFSVIAAFWFDTEVLQEMKDMPLSSMQRYLVHKLPPKGVRTWMAHDLMLSTELRIGDFYGNAILLQRLKNKMARFRSFTNQSEEEMMIVIDKLEKKVDKLSKTIDDMSSIAQNYSDDIRQARLALEIDNEHMEVSHKQLVVKRKR